MPRPLKSVPGLCSVLILTSLSVAAPFLVRAAEEVPAGFKVDRYRKIWEQNPFTLVTPVAQQAQPTLFDKLILISWLNDGGKDVVFVQNTETNDVQKVTKDPNTNNMRLVEVHKNSDPQKAEVVLASGAEQGSVKFRLETPAVAPQAEGGRQAPLPSAGGQTQVPGMPAPVVPGMQGQMQLPQNAQQAARLGAAQMQQGATPIQQDSGIKPPRATEVRRKRITPPAGREQQVGQAPNQSPANQPQPQ